MAKAFSIMTFVVILFVLSQPCYAQWAIAYEKGAAGSIRETSDGGYVVAGHTGSLIPDTFDLCVLRLNPDGSLAWQKTYGGSSTDSASSIQQTLDGGYVVAGHTGSFGTDNFYDLWVLKLNSDGTIVWQKTYGGSSGDRAKSIQQTSDDGYIVAGDTGSFGAGLSDFWVLKLNSDGTIAWQKTYGGSSQDMVKSIQQTSDGGYIVAGDTWSLGPCGVDFWVLKLNSDGSIDWQKAYGENLADSAGSIQQTSDGGYVVAGHTESFDDDLWVLKLNSDGTIAWQKAYGGSLADGAHFIQQTSDGGYIVAGYTNSFGTGDQDLWILRLEPDGSVAWQKTYGGSSEDLAFSIQQTFDEGYIVAGHTKSFGAGDYDFWVLKLDSIGNISDSNIVRDSDAITSDTMSIITDTSISPSNTSATVNNTNAIPQNSTAIKNTGTERPKTVLKQEATVNKRQNVARSRSLSKKDAIIGKWGNSEMNIEFVKGGTIILVGMMPGGVQLVGTYQFIDENRIRVGFSGLMSMAGPQIWNIISVSEDDITIYMPTGDGNPITIPKMR